MGIVVILGIAILFWSINISDKKDKTSTPSKQSLNNSNYKNNDDKKSTDDKISSKDNKQVTKNMKENNNANKSESNTLLLKIKSYADKGKVINSTYKLGDSINSVISKLGKPSSESYIESAKGDYFRFDSNNLVFGCNKGEEIFEIRSLEKSLNELELNNVENFFGKPDYNITTKLNEKIIGYKISKKVKILFVFNNKTLKLKHYSVLYPELTKNSMSGYGGREW